MVRYDYKREALAKNCGKRLYRMPDWLGSGGIRFADEESYLRIRDPLMLIAFDRRRSRHFRAGISPIAPEEMAHSVMRFAEAMDRAGFTGYGIEFLIASRPQFSRSTHDDVRNAIRGILPDIAGHSRIGSVFMQHARYAVINPPERSLTCVGNISGQGLLARMIDKYF